MKQKNKDIQILINICVAIIGIIGLILDEFLIWLENQPLSGTTASKKNKSFRR